MLQKAENRVYLRLQFITLDLTISSSVFSVLTTNNCKISFNMVLRFITTLAWGVNLPAHAVIIKGTELYDASRGGWVNVDILDVIQIFGRAGRPQFDTTGEGCLIGMHDSIDSFARLMVMKVMIRL